MAFPTFPMVSGGSGSAYAHAHPAHPMRPLSASASTVSVNGGGGGGGGGVHEQEQVGALARRVDGLAQEMHLAHGDYIAEVQDNERLLCNRLDQMEQAFNHLLRNDQIHQQRIMQLEAQLRHLLQQQQQQQPVEMQTHHHQLTPTLEQEDHKVEALPTTMPVRCHSADSFPSHEKKESSWATRVSHVSHVNPRSHAQGWSIAASGKHAAPHPQTLID